MLPVDCKCDNIQCINALTFKLLSLLLQSYGMNRVGFHATRMHFSQRMCHDKQYETNTLRYTLVTLFHLLKIIIEAVV